MTELQSSLLSPEVIQEQQSITILPIQLGKSPCRKLVTRFGITNTSKHTTESITATVYRVDDSRVLGYIPSKIWWNCDDGELNFLYYISPTLPAAARPFGDKPCYVFTRIINNDEMIDYPIYTRILIDQVLIRDHMYYVFMFADKEAKSVLTTTWAGKPWPIDVPEAVLYKGDILDLPV